MSSMPKHRKLIRYNHLTSRIFSVQYRISFFPAPKLNDPAGAGQTKQRFLSRSIDADKIARLQDHTSAVHVFDIGHGDGLYLHPVAIGPSRSIASGQNRCNRRLTGGREAKVEPMDPGIQQIPFVALDLDLSQFSNLTAENAVDDFLRCGSGP